MSTYFHDVMDFGAVGDGVANDTRAFADAIMHATDNGGMVVASGRFRVSGYLGITCDCDWSQATLVIAEAMLVIGYTSDYLSTHQKVFTPTDKTRLVTLQSSLQGTLDSDSLKAFENAFVRVEASGANAAYINKANGGGAQNKFSVSLLNKYGRLSYSLSHDFTEVAEVRITLRRLPAERLTFRCPAFEIEKFPTSNYLLKVNRDLVTIRDFTLSHGTPAVAEEAYYGLIGCHECYDVMFENTTLPGYGITNSEPGVTQKVRNDLILGKVLKVKVDTLSGNTGWKTVQCSHARDLRLYNANLYGLHTMFNCADLTLRNCRVGTGGVLLSTGAPDSCITLEDCVFSSKFGGAVALYPDYGDLRGKLVIANCQLLMSSLTEDGRTVTLLSLTETAIQGADQPNAYALPTAIVMRDLFIQCKGDCDLITFNSGDVYTDKRRLAAPRSILLDNLKMQSLDGGDMNFSYSFISHDHADAEPVAMTLRNIENLSGHVTLDLKAGSQSTADKLQYALDVCDARNLRVNLAAGRRSTARFQQCDLLRLNTGIATKSRLKSLKVADCTFHFDRSSTVADTLSVASSIQGSHFSNCVFDASRHKAELGKYFNLKTLVHVANGCMSIDCHGDGSDDPGRGLKILVPKAGTEGCYATTTDGTLVPLT